MRISDWSSDVCSSDLSVVRSLLASIVTLRSPRDLQLVVVCADDAEDAWSWTQWLHLVDPKDRKSVVAGKSVTVRVNLGGHRCSNMKKSTTTNRQRQRESQCTRQ